LLASVVSSVSPCFSNPKGFFVITSAGRAKLVLLAGVTLVAVVLTLAFAGSSAAAAPTRSATAHAVGSAAAAKNGDNGTVKIHRSTTPVDDRRNQPHVCSFYLDAFGFDPAQSVSWQIKSWPPTGDRTVAASGVLSLDGNGAGRTADMGLPDGHYKLFWNFTGEKGFAKQKVFWVACGAPTPPPTHHPKPTPSHGPSHGPKPSPSGPGKPSPSGPPTTPATPTISPSLAGGSGPSSPGGLPITGWPLALIAAAGVGLLGTGSAAIVAARRRRGLHVR
jgi:hypothetical protein